MKQFQVPQFIDVEDRILGFITMRQFFIMLIPIGAGILFYFVLDLWLAIILFIPIFAIACVFAFVKPNGLRFSRFLASFLSYTFKPRLYVWKQQNSLNKLDLGDISNNKEKDAKLSKGLKAKKGELETGSKITEEDIQNIASESEYLDEILNE